MCVCACARTIKEDEQRCKRHLYGNPIYRTDDGKARKLGHVGAMAGARLSMSVAALYVYDVTWDYGSALTCSFFAAERKRHGPKQLDE